MPLEKDTRTFERLGTWENRDMKACDRSIKETLELVEQMIQLADEGDRVREDSGCGILYGVLRDSAFRIKQLAEKERDAHIRKGWWED